MLERGETTDLLSKDEWVKKLVAINHLREVDKRFHVRP